MKNSNWRRLDTLFFGSIFTVILFTLIIAKFNIKWFEGTIFESNWISLIWLITLFLCIIPVRFFPKTKWSKWWNDSHNSKKLTN